MVKGMLEKFCTHLPVVAAIIEVFVVVNIFVVPVANVCVLDVVALLMLVVICVHVTNVSVTAWVAMHALVPQVVELSSMSF